MSDHAINGGGDTYLGGTGQNELIETRTTDVSFTLTNTTISHQGISAARWTDLGFQLAKLTSGAATNSWGDAQRIGLLHSTATELIYFNGGARQRGPRSATTSMIGILADVRSRP